MMNILIMSDIHGNIEALKSVKNKIEKEQIDAMILLGDIIDYGPHSNEAVSLLCQFPYEILCNIRGNHEDAVINDIYGRFSADRGRVCARHTRERLDRKTWDYIKTVMFDKPCLEFTVEDKLCLAVHGSLEDPSWKSIRPGMDLTEYAKYSYVFSGHSHLPHLFAEYHTTGNQVSGNKKTTFVNPGSVGQPRNHNPCAQFAVWETATDGFRMYCTQYDIRREQEAFSGEVDVFYKERLAEGI